MKNKEKFLVERMKALLRKVICCMFYLFKNRDFKFFVIARLILDLGKKISWVALAWFVYELTNSASVIGFVITSATIAPLLSSIFVGSLLDEFNRRTIMIAENVLRGIFILLIPLLYWGDELTLPIILIVVFINGLLSAFTDIGSMTILPAFVDQEDLQSANTLVAMAGQSGYLIGPAIGGFSAAYIGASLTLIVAVFFFFLAAILYFFIPYSSFQQGVEPRRLKKRNYRIIKEIVDGFTFLRNHRVLIIISSVTLIFNITYAPLEPVLPVFVGSHLNSGPDTLGMIWTVFAVGALLGSFIWVRLNIPIYYSYSLGIVISLWGVAPLLISFFTNETIVYLIMFFGGMVYAPYNIVEPTLEQKLIPNHLRGRVIGVMGFIAGIGFPFDTFIGGLLGEYFGAANTLFMSGLATIILGLTVSFQRSLRFSNKDVN